jgi:hypothetical protein
MRQLRGAIRQERPQSCYAGEHVLLSRAHKKDMLFQAASIQSRDECRRGMVINLVALSQGHASARYH